MFASVLIDQSHHAIDRCFTYRVPNELIDQVKVGSRVRVPFASQRSLVDGYVLEINPSIDGLDNDKIKEIGSCCEQYPILLESIIPLARWISENYFCTLIDAIKLFVRPVVRQKVKTERTVSLVQSINDETLEKDRRISKQMIRVIKALQDNERVTVSQLKKLANVTGSPIQSLHKRGWIKFDEKTVYRTPWSETTIRSERPKQLTNQQENVLEAINHAMESKGQNFLLRGVTGSGKTEVYIQAIEKCLNNGKTAIVLVPEISLTPQTANRFRQRFGERVALLHSALSYGEKRDEWARIYEEKVSVVVGARSALFSPLKNIGIIIVDEAHEDSYKSDIKPRYHAIDVAKKRCELEQAVLVLGTATPRLVDQYQAEHGQLTLLTLSQRVDNQKMPEVNVVDMRLELEKGNRSVFSRQLIRGLNQTIRNKEQAILLMNRRGYASFVSCRSCGFVVKCKKCDVSMTYHGRQDNGQLICHYCGEVANYPKICPECGSKYIKYFGAGTQKIESELLKLIPTARVMRMDADTTTRKGSHQAMIESFLNHEYDILLGTQMVAKGLDFPNVTLVGIMAADTFLNLPDYRSAERAFQLMTQAAGRAGRSKKSGQVMIQTYQPNHVSVQRAMNHDFMAFYEQEILIRKQFDYPPFVSLVRFLITGLNEGQVQQEALELNSSVRKAKEDGISCVISSGAYQAPIAKIKEKYRWNVIIKLQPQQKNQAVNDLFQQLIQRKPKKDVQIALDINPTIIL